MLPLFVLRLGLGASALGWTRIVEVMAAMAQYEIVEVPNNMVIFGSFFFVYFTGGYWRIMIMGK